MAFLRSQLVRLSSSSHRALSSHGNSETGNQRPELDDLTEQVANLGGSVSIY